MSDNDDFDIEDESIEDLKSAWKRGEKGRSTGPRDINARAGSIVNRAVARFEAEGIDASAGLRVATGTTARPDDTVRGAYTAVKSVTRRDESLLNA